MADLQLGVLDAVGAAAVLERVVADAAVLVMGTRSPGGAARLPSGRAANPWF